MKASFVLFILFSHTQGLNLRLDLDTETFSQYRRACGVLTCEESYAADVSNMSADKSSPQRTISSMSIFKTQKSSPSGDGDSLKGDPFVILTPQQSKIIRVSDGVKIDGVLEARRAELRLEMVKEVDCSAFYSCEVRTSDDQGNELVQTNRLYHRPGGRDDFKGGEALLSREGLQQLALLRQQVTLLGATIDGKLGDLETRLDGKLGDLETRLDGKLGDLETRLDGKLGDLETRLDGKLGDLDGKFGVLETHLDAMQDRLEDKIMSVENQMEIRVVDKLCQLETKLSAADDNDPHNVSGTLGEIRSSLLSLGKKLKDEKQKDVRVDGVVNCDDKLTTVHEQLSEILAWEERNHLGFKDLVQVNVKLINSSEELSDRLQSDFSDLYNNFHTDFEELRAGVQNSSTETLSAVRDMIAHTNTTAWNNLKTVLDLVDNLTPKECKRGMVPTLLGTAFPYHVIQPDDDSVIDIPHLCDSVTDGGGWIVIQRRSSGVENFYRNWADYREGFGSLNGDFWWGNNNIHKLTSSGNYELRVDIKYNGQSKFAHYKSFSIDGENNNFVLHIGGYDGSAGDSLTWHNGKPFSTHDKDNDRDAHNLAEVYGGAWWYQTGGGYASNLNGQWGTKGNERALAWSTYPGYRLSLTFSEMKIRRV